MTRKHLRSSSLSLLMWAAACFVPAAAQEIKPVGPEGGDVRSLAVHPLQPERFFLGTSDGQIFVSHDSGLLWERLKPGLERRNLVIDNLAFHPRRPEVLYAATWELQSDGGWLFRTEDGGQSWSEIPLGRYQKTIRAIAIAPSDPATIALGIPEGVILSRDEGRTWDRITRGYRSLYSVESLAFDPQEAETLYVGTWHLGWKTTDAGKSWKAIHEGMISDSDMFSVLVNPENTDVLYSSACTGIYKSTDAGLKWTKLKNGLPQEARRTRTLQLDSTRTDTLYAGTTLGLFTSHDAGNSWVQTVEDVVVNAIASSPGHGRVILLGTDDAGILRSSDGGATFSPSNRGFVHRQVRSVARDPADGSYYAGVSWDGAFGGFFRSRGDEGRWETYNEGLGSASADIRSILTRSRSRGVYLGTSQGLFAGTPFREPWRRIEGSQEMAIADLAFADASEEQVLLATETGLFSFHPSQEKLQKVQISGRSGSVNSILPAHDFSFLLVGTDQGLYRSSDRGRTWEKRGRGLPESAVNVLASNGRRLFAGTRSGLFQSDDQGESWTASPGIFPIDIVAVQADQTGRVFAADSVAGHLYYSENGGDAWKILDSDNGSRIASLAMASRGRVLAGTLSDGIYLIGPGVESVADGR